METPIKILLFSQQTTTTALFWTALPNTDGVGEGYSFAEEVVASTNFRNFRGFPESTTGIGVLLPAGFTLVSDDEPVPTQVAFYSNPGITSRVTICLTGQDDKYPIGRPEPSDVIIANFFTIPPSNTTVRVTFDGVPNPFATRNIQPFLRVVRQFSNGPAFDAWEYLRMIGLIVSWSPW